jgi:MGT family glycosyltransferase
VRVLVAVMPIAGHIAPVTGLVAELVDRGHQVRVYTGARYGDRMAQLGATAVPWSAAPDFSEDDLAAAGLGPAGVPRLLAMVQRVFIQSGTGQVADLSRELDRSPADLVVGDVLSIGAGLVGELRGIPWAGVSLLALAVPSLELPPPGFPFAPARDRWGRLRDRAAWLAYRAATSGAHRAYNQVRTGLGLPPDRQVYGAALTSPWLLLATGAPSLEQPRADLPDQVHFVGRLAPVRRPAAQGAPSRSGPRPLVIVTQGTHNVDPRDLVEPALRGLASLDVQLIATTGRPGHSTVDVPVPQNATVVDFLDFAAALPEAAALVTNGGWGGLLESLQAGVPVVVAGRDIDKPQNAARMARAGVGVDLRTGRPRPAAIAAAVDRVLTDPGYADRARRVGAELAALGGARSAVDLLEELARTGAPVRRAANPWSPPR